MNGDGCEENLERAKENYLVAAKLDFIWAMRECGLLLEENDPQRILWLGKAAVRGHRPPFISDMIEQMERFNSGARMTNLVFAIGSVLLQKNVSTTKREIFGPQFRLDEYIASATQAIEFYTFQLQSYRRAVEVWTIVGIRNRIVKDIRKMIGKMIWEAKEDAEYVPK